MSSFRQTRKVVELMLDGQPMERTALRRSPGYMIYEDKAEYDRAAKVLIAAILGVLIVAATVLLFFAIAGAVAIFGDALLFALIFYFVLPRRYQVFNTKLRIVLGWPLSWDIPVSTIEAAQAGSGIARWTRSGVSLATSSGTRVKIVRSRGMNLVISPSNRDRFLQLLNYVVRRARARGG